MGDKGKRKEGEKRRGGKNEKERRQRKKRFIGHCKRWGKEKGVCVCGCMDGTQTSTEIRILKLIFRVCEMTEQSKVLATKPVT